MAEIIPNRIPSSATRGERTTYELLQKLPDDYLVYYEPNIKNRRPDFVIIAPDLGVIVIEVKGWTYDQILNANDKDILLVRDNRETHEVHPLEQARKYQWRLAGVCENNPKRSLLFNDEGIHKNRFSFPFCHFVILSNITRDQIERIEEPNLYEIFKPENTLYRDQIKELKDASPEKLKQTLQRFFDPWWPITPFTEEQIDVLRSIIHPEIVLSPLQSRSLKAGETDQCQDLVILDRKQENNARRIGEGHRIIYGVAGSGKTVILISRSKWLHDENPGARILLVCYNVVLSVYLKHVLEKYPRIQVFHFDGWAKHNGITRQAFDSSANYMEDDVSLGKRLLEHLKEQKGDYRSYDAILVDEAQDFPPVWFSCILEALANPNEGDLLIVCDGNQGIRLIDQVSWKSLGIKAQGRTIHQAFDLDRNYRNTREILKLAAHFTVRNPKNDDDTISIIPVNPNLAIRRGEKPILYSCKDRSDECQKIIEIIKRLIDGKIPQNDTPITIIPSEIGVLYLKKPVKDNEVFQHFLKELRALTSVTWLNEDYYARLKVFDPTLKIQTVASSKGLQYRIGIIMWADLFEPHTSSDIEIEPRLMYVALTRASDILIITHSRPNAFIDRMIDSGDCVLISSDSELQKKSENFDPNEKDKTFSQDERREYPDAYASVGNKIIKILETGETQPFSRAAFHTFLQDQIAALATDYQLKSRCQFVASDGNALWGSADVTWLMDSVPVAVFEIDSSFRLKSVWNLTQLNVPHKFWVYCGKMDFQTLRKIEAIEKEHSIHVIHLNREIKYIRGRSRKETPESLKSVQKIHNKKSEINIPPSLMETYNLYFDDYPIQEIANIRGFKPSTISDHFIQLMHLGIIIEIDTLVPEEKRQRISDAIDQVGNRPLKPLKDLLGPDYSYDEIKLVIAYNSQKKMT